VAFVLARVAPPHFVQSQIADCGLSRTAYNIRSQACQLDATTPQHDDGAQQDVPHRADGQQETAFQPQSTLFHPTMSRSMVHGTWTLQAPPLLDYHCHGTTSECSTAKVNPTLTTIVLSPALNAAKYRLQRWGAAVLHGPA
jgi:hypothetical protein